MKQAVFDFLAVNLKEAVFRQIDPCVPCVFLPCVFLNLQSQFVWKWEISVYEPQIKESFAVTKPALCSY